MTDNKLDLDASLERHGIPWALASLAGAIVLLIGIILMVFLV